MHSGRADKVTPSNQLNIYMIYYHLLPPDKSPGYYLRKAHHCIESEVISDHISYLQYNWQRVSKSLAEWGYNLSCNTAVRKECAHVFPKCWKSEAMNTDTKN